MSLKLIEKIIQLSFCISTVDLNSLAAIEALHKVPEPDKPEGKRR